ncbi:diguanylate cyclase domain-containing protein [Cupriavidus sp. AU9028]|uniref:sensor domain-containing diguanylate cyclase n=1 Tax=Cupriavidus sp. AU9028 TaxID=2871157 RepID=UPI001C980AE3|nr:diguanylate cyclase [Cupriavidus sp. AU9028]MBY4896892.1 diguanylate cyclase [Cupriavidus sp. AU9028]
MSSRPPRRFNTAPDGQHGAERRAARRQSTEDIEPALDPVAAGKRHGERKSVLSLKARIAVRTTAFAAVLGAGIVLASLHAVHGDLRAALQEQQDSVVKLTALQMDTAIEGRMLFLEHAAPRLAGQMDASHADLMAILQQSVPIPQSFSRVVVVNQHGELLTSGGTIQVADRAYFREAVRSRQPVITSPLRSREDGSTGIVFAVPILSKDSSFLGLVNGWIDLADGNFLTEIAHSPVGATGYYCLVSTGEHPVYVQHHDQSRIGQPARAVGETCGATAKSSRFEFLTPTEPVIARYLMPSTGWELVGVLPADEAFQPLRAMQRRLLRLSGIAVAIFVALNWLMVWHLLSPLTRLRAVVQQSVRDPAAYERLSPGRRDEIGVLSRAFARLMRALAERREQLYRSEQRLRAVTDTLPSLLASVDLQGRYIFNNLAYEKAFGLPVAQLHGMTMRELLGDEQFERIRPYLEQAYEGKVSTFETEFEQPEYHCVETTFRPEWNAEGSQVVGVHIHVQDVTARRLEANRLARLSQLDHLTQLLNRNGFEARLAQAVRDSGESNRLLALCYLDLDRFKAVNDSHGHDAGDQLLQIFARRLHGCVREHDAVCRLGGDEFAIIAEDVAGPEVPRRIAEAVLRAVAEPFLIDGARLEVGASIGIALVRGRALSPRDLTRCADALLYRAKARGRARFEMEWAEAVMDSGLDKSA